MEISKAKAIFIFGTILSSIIFIALTYDSISKMPHRRSEDKLTAKVADGKWIWQKYNCNDCHTILEIGGYSRAESIRDRIIYIKKSGMLRISIVSLLNFG